MNILSEYKDDILKIDAFVKTLDPAVRGEAFKFLVAQVVPPKGKHGITKLGAITEEHPEDQAQRILEKLSVESAIPTERLMEVYTVKDSVVQVIDSSIPNDGPTDLLKKITLLCVYGNIIGRGLAKVDAPTIYKNLKTLNAATSAYSRDVKNTEGAKVLADGVMLTGNGREIAQELLRTILKLGV